MKFFIKTLLPVALLLTSLVFVTSCVDQEFDEPPGHVVKSNSNTTIGELLAMITNTPTKITEDIVIEGIVISDDEAGNFYKELRIQDGTGGINLSIDAVSLYSAYPVGRRVYVNCKDLYLGRSNNLPTLGGSLDGTDIQRINSGLIDRFIEKGATGQTLVPRDVSIADLGPDDVNTLVRLSEVEFVEGLTGGTYADAVTSFGLNRDIANCNGDQIIVRTSGFADFAGVEMASGNGTLVAVMSIYNNDLQLQIRDLEDVKMDSDRCGSGNQGGELISIAELRNTFSGSEIAAPEGKKIKGIVISDWESGNITGRNLVVQEPAGDGIVIRFDANHSFRLNDEIEVNLSGGLISEFNGLLQVGDVANVKASKIGTGNITPAVVTVSQIKNDLEAYESTLVKIEDAMLSGGGTFSGSLTLTDGSGSIDLYTRSGANFATNAVPSGEVSVTAIVSQFNSEQLNMRKGDDVEGGTTGGGGGGNEDLMSISDVRSLFTGANTTAPNNKKIKGIVISDYTTGNITGRNLVLQEEGGKGIIIRLDVDNAFAMGDELEVVISNLEVSEFNGLLQLNNVPTSNATKLSSGNMLTPTAITISDLLADFEDYESTLVTITGAEISGGATYEGGLTITDATGTIDLYTRSQASFATAAVATGTVSITAYVGQFNDSKQLSIRNLADIQ